MFTRTAERMRKGERPHPLLNGAEAWTRQLATAAADFERETRVAAQQLVEHRQLDRFAFVRPEGIVQQGFEGGVGAHGAELGGGRREMKSPHRAVAVRAGEWWDLTRPRWSRRQRPRA